MLPNGKDLVTLIDDAVVADAEDGRRAHLGASLIGRKCERELWYSFRWAANKGFSGRLYRLFNRGHLEEFRFVAYLRRIGCEVREYSERLIYTQHLDNSEPYAVVAWGEIIDTEVSEDVTGDPLHIARAKRYGIELKQWRIKDVLGHFGGSCDGRAFNVPFLHPDEETLLEFKTFGTKPFSKLCETRDRLWPQGKPVDGLSPLREAKPEHWTQMQVYMHKMGLKIGLYLGVNKNDDDLYSEYVAYDPQGAAEAIAKADRVISAPTPPNRLWNNASNFDCKYCDFVGPCHLGKPLLKGCRTCRMSEPRDNGEWFCKHWSSTIPLDAQKNGCDNWVQIHD